MKKPTGELVAHCLFIKSEKYPRLENYSIYYEKEKYKKNKKDS